MRDGGTATAGSPIPAAIAMVQQTIDRIEQSLNQDLVLEDLARSAGMSFWHFLRVFRTTVGETLKDYIRRRRLTMAAYALIERQDTVLTIALEAGFDSHEAFTRAFRHQFGCSPREFRQRGEAPLFPRARPEISAAYLQHLQSGISRQPLFVLHSDMRLIGVRQELTVPPHEFDVLELGLPLWQQFLSSLPQVAQRLDPQVLFVCDILASNDDHVRCVLMPCVAVRDFAALPEGWVATVRPRSRDAVFHHQGTGHSWEYTMQYLYGVWLGESGFALSDLPLLYRFDPVLSPFSATPQLELWLGLR